MWPSVAVGVLMLGLFAAWMGGVFKVKTPDGVIVLENVPKDSEILVDGNKITFAWPGGGKPVEIRAVPGQHRVEVKKDGFKTFGEAVTFKTDDAEEVTVRLEALEDRSGFLPLFNGKDLSGWTIDPGTEADWTARDGVIRGKPTVPYTAITTARSDYGDFHLRMEIYKNADGTMIRFREVKRIEDSRYYSFRTGTIQPDGTISPPGIYVFRKTGPGTNPTHDGLHELTAPASSPLTRDTWHVVEIIAAGNIFRMRVDGREVSAFSDTQARLKQGHISIQLLKGAVVDFRNIEVKELNGTNRSINLDPSIQTRTVPNGKTAIEDLKVGTGPLAKPGDTVTLHYVGTLLDGTKFDDSRERGKPITFLLGKGNVIRGWHVGVKGMQIGGIRKLVIPPEEAYGSRGAGRAIPANATLFFEAELIKIQ